MAFSVSDINLDGECYENCDEENVNWVRDRPGEKEYW